MQQEWEIRGVRVVDGLSSSWVSRGCNGLGKGWGTQAIARDLYAMTRCSLILIGQRDECESVDLADGARDEDDVHVQGGSVGGILVGSARCLPNTLLEPDGWLV